MPPPSAAATVEESAKKGLDSSYTPGSIVNKYTASKKTDYDTANLGQWTSQVGLVSYTVRGALSDVKILHCLIS